MSTGYPGSTTTPEVRALEPRVARLEERVERHEREAADRRMWAWYCGYSAIMAIGID